MALDQPFSLIVLSHVIYEDSQRLYKSGGNHSASHIQLYINHQRIPTSQPTLRRYVQSPKKTVSDQLNHPKSKNHPVYIGFIFKEVGNASMACLLDGILSSIFWIQPSQHLHGLLFPITCHCRRIPYVFAKPKKCLT